MLLVQIHLLQKCSLSWPFCETVVNRELTSLKSVILSAEILVMPGTVGTAED